MLKNGGVQSFAQTGAQEGAEINSKKTQRWTKHSRVGLFTNETRPRSSDFLVNFRHGQARKLIGNRWIDGFD